jgi:hypothetical protein
VSTKRKRGHIRSGTSGEDARGKEAAANDPGTTGDGGRDTFSWSLGIGSGTATRRECEPCVPLAEAISRRAAGKQRNHETPAGRGWGGEIDRDGRKPPCAIGNDGGPAVQRDCSPLWERGCSGIAGCDRVFDPMIGPPAGTRIWIAAGVTDLRRGIAWTMRVVVAVSLLSGIVGLLLAAKFYVFQEIFAGLLTIAVLLAVGVVLLVVFVSLREIWQYCLHRAMNTRSVKAGRHNRRDSRGAALLGVDSQQGRRPRARRAA